MKCQACLFERAIDVLQKTGLEDALALMIFERIGTLIEPDKGRIELAELPG